MCVGVCLAEEMEERQQQKNGKGDNSRSKGKGGAIETTKNAVARCGSSFSLYPSTIASRLLGVSGKDLGEKENAPRHMLIALNLYLSLSLPLYCW